MFARERVATLVLAAGSGTRMGGPKALVAWPSKTASSPPRPLAIAHAEARLAAESGRVVVVTRAAILGALLGYVRPGIDIVTSDAADELGPAGSIAAAMHRLDGVDAVIVTPVDSPPASEATVALLLEKLAATPGALAARSTYHGRGGHPVAVSIGALDRYRAADPPPLRDVLHAMGPQCVDVDVDDRAVVLDMNTPADVMGILGALPKFLR